jgi:hypothetical protein
MNHLALKNKVLDDLQLIIDLAMQDVKNSGGTADHLLNFSGKKLAKQKDDLISDLCENPGYCNIGFSIETDNQKIEFPASCSAGLQYSIKNGWGDGTTKQPVKNRRKELEGVHYPWINPVVKFEPYGTFELPQKLDWLPEYYKKLKRVA